MLDEAKTCDPDMSTDESDNTFLRWFFLIGSIAIGVIFVGVVLWRSKSQNI
jgi:hypothetical protein